MGYSAIPNNDITQASAFTATATENPSAGDTTPIYAFTEKSDGYPSES